MNEELIEQVARAIAEYRGRLHWKCYIGEAQAAIAATFAFIREQAGRMGHLRMERRRH